MSKEVMIQQFEEAIDFTVTIDRRNSDSAKWGHYAPDILPMWVADTDFTSPAPIREAVLARTQHNVFGYGRESATLRQVLCERMSTRYGWQITPEMILYLPGLVCGLNLVTRTIGKPGDGVLANTPVYPPFLSAPGNQDRLSQMVEKARTVREGHLYYEVDFDEFENTIQENTRLFILCNPHNPTGRAFDKQELLQIAEICTRHNLIICSDEIHCDLLLGDTQHTPIASLAPEIAARTITLMAPSKTFNVPGLGCSMAIIPDPELRKQVSKAAMGIIPHVNVLGMVAAEAAYSDPACDLWLQGLRKHLTGNRDFLVDYVDRHLPALKTTVPQATYLAWLDCREAGITEPPYQFFLEKAKVALNNGTLFGKGGEGFVRLNFGCTRATLQEGLERMRQALG